MKTFLTAVSADLLPVILQLIGVVLAALIARAANTARARWGIEIEARHREALHSALMSGITSALSKGLAPRAAVDAAVSYTFRSVPDAIAALDPSPDVLSNLAEAKLRQALAASPIYATGDPVSMPKAAGAHVVIGGGGGTVD